MESFFVNLVSYSFAIPSILMIIITFSVIIYIIVKGYKKDENNEYKYNVLEDPSKDKFIKVVFAIALVIGLATPALFMVGILGAIFQDFKGIILTITVIILIVLLTKLYSVLRNKVLVGSSGGEQIYVRDIPSSLSPAVVSYLYNQKIEKEKDVVATILNLCAKKVIKLEFNEDNKVIIKNIKKTNVELTKDEEYIYNWLTKKIEGKFRFNEWETIVKNEYYQCGFSNNSKLNFYNISRWLYFIVFIIIFISVALFEDKINASETLVNGVMTVLVVSFAISFLGGIITAVKQIFTKNSDTNSIYTRKGAKELAKWNKFKKFIEDFSLIKDANVESIIILERYLAYGIALGVNKNYDELEFKELSEFLKTKLDFSMDEYIQSQINNEF